MRILPPDEIQDRLQLAGFDVAHPEEWGDGEYLLVVEDCHREKLRTVVDALAAGYRTEINLREPGYELVLRNMG